MKSKLATISHLVNGVVVKQRIANGFINSTAICTAHGKKIDSWFRTKDTLDLFEALAVDLRVSINRHYWK